MDVPTYCHNDCHQTVKKKYSSSLYLILLLLVLLIFDSVIVDCKKVGNYYDLLGLKATANDRDIKKAFRKLALKYHPDKNKEPGAEDKFRLIAEAYAVLSDPDKKKKYDELGHDAYVASGGEGFGSGQHQEGPYPGFDMNDFFRHFDDAFQFHSSRSQHQYQRQGHHHYQEEEYHERPHFNHHFQRQHQGHRKHYQENPHAHHERHQRSHMFHGFNFDDLFNEMDSDDFGSFFQSSSGHFHRQQQAAYDPFGDFHEFGGGDSFFGSHCAVHSAQEEQHSQSRRCRTVTKRSGNSVMTYTECS